MHEGPIESFTLKRVKNSTEGKRKTLQTFQSRHIWRALGELSIQFKAR